MDLQKFLKDLKTYSEIKEFSHSLGSTLDWILNYETKFSMLDGRYWLRIYFTTPFSVAVSFDPKLHLGGTWERDFWGGSNTFNDSSAAREGRNHKKSQTLLVSRFLNKNQGRDPNEAFTDHCMMELKI